MPKFQVYKDAAGKYRFRLRADNNKIIAAGEAYEQYAGCINGIKSIQKNSKAPIEDTTVEGQRFSNPKFQVYKDNAGKFRFRLFARNGEIIADSSEGYETKDACLNGIAVVGQSDSAEINDLTQSQDAVTKNIEAIAPTMSVETKTSQNIEMPKTEGSIMGQSVSAGINDLTKSEETTTTKAEDTAKTIFAETKAPQSSEMSKPKGIIMDREDEILAELKKISAALEKAPPPVPPKGFMNEFKAFISQYKILGLAVAFIIGLYLGLLVQALVKDFIIPLLGLLIPGMSDLATYTATVLSQVFGIGDFLVALITFIAVALIVFIIVKVAKRMKIE
jgi:large conductance mechanosensitive channel protein